MLPTPPAVKHSRHIPSAKENQLPIRHKKPSSSEQKTEKQLPAKSNSVHLTACTKGVLYAVRALSEGDCDIKDKHTLSLDEYNHVLYCIEQVPPYNSLKGFWEDKLRYDYDSISHKFRFRMPASYIHEQMTAAISEQIRDWLKSLKQDESTTLRRFAREIEETGSVNITYTMRAESPPSFKAAIGPDSPSTKPKRPSPTYRSSKTPVVEPREGLRSSTNIQQAGLTAESSKATGRKQEAPVAESSKAAKENQKAPIAKSSQATKLKTGSYCPDNSWKFDSKKVPDDQPAFVLELKKTQDPDNLLNKIQGYLRNCDVQAVLACSVEFNDDSGATLELWTADDLKAPKWSIEIVDADGDLPEQISEEGKVLLDYFIKPSTLFKYKDIDSHNSNIVNRLEEYQPQLILDAESLGLKLISLREKDRAREREKARAEREREKARAQQEQEKAGSQKEPERGTKRDRNEDEIARYTKGRKTR